MCFYILYFYHRCYQAETISVIGWLLLKDLKVLYNIEQKKIPVHILHTPKQSNLNALINHTLYNTSKLFHILCESRLSEF
jgi:hypothetical protein